MSMQDLPDDELDKLFRKSAEEFERPFNPQAWDAMRQKLDDDDDNIVTGFAWWKTGVAVLILAIMGIGGYYALTNKTTQHPIKNSIPSSPQSIIEDASKTKAIPTTKATIPTHKNGEEIPSIAVEKDVKDAKKSITFAPKMPLAVNEKAKRVPSVAQNRTVAQNRSRNSILAHKSLKNQNVLVENNTLQTPKRLNLTESSVLEDIDIADMNKKSKSKVESKLKNQVIKTPLPQKEITTETLFQNEIVPSNAISEKTSSEFSQEIALIKVSPLAILSWKSNPMVLSIPSINYDIPDAPLFVKNKQNPSSFFRKSLGIRTLIAPDLSYITMNQMMKQPTIAVGVVLDYRFSKRWSVQAGGIRTVKLYNATPDQYYWPESWNSQKVRPIDIGAECKIIDIPLNLRYDINQSSKGRWFVNAGISSYIMLNEKYEYTYAPHTYNIKWKTWEGTTGNYWLGILNISMGFERQIGRNWSLQVEPYLKVPLAQVGMGKVMLNTSGIYFSARYRLGRF